MTNQLLAPEPDPITLEAELKAIIDAQARGDWKEPKLGETEASFHSRPSSSPSRDRNNRGPSKV